MANRYSAEQATDAIASLDLDVLSPKEIEVSLKNIISQLDTIPFNTSNSATTVLYSGASVEEIKDNPKFRVLDNTEAYKFLMGVNDNKPLKNALHRAYGEKPDFNNWTSNTGIFIGGDDSVMPRVGGAWDWVSANFVQNAQGNVVTNIGEHAGVNRVFFQTELPALKENSNITHINGVEKQTLFKQLESMGDVQHQLDYFKTVTYIRTEVFSILKEEQHILLDSPFDVSNKQIHEVLQSHPHLRDKISALRFEHFTKTEISKASGIPYDKISEDEIKTFLSSQTLESKAVIAKVENYINFLQHHDPHIKHFDLHSHAKYSIVGGVIASILATKEADASTVTPFYLNQNNDSYENLSKSEQIGAQIGAGFNGINLIQAGQEFKEGASKSPHVLLDSDAYKKGFSEMTDAWKHNPSKEVVKLGAMQSAKFAGKSALKKLPLIGFVAGIAFGIGRAMEGDWSGAALEIASGASSIIPGAGTLASTGIDAVLLERDTHLISHGAKILMGKESKTEISDHDNTRSPSSMNLNINENEIKTEQNIIYTRQGVTEAEKNKLTQCVEKSISTDDSSAHTKVLIADNIVTTSKLSDLKIVYSTNSTESKEIDKVKQCIIDDIYQNLSFVNPQQNEENLDLDRGMD